MVKLEFYLDLLRVSFARRDVFDDILAKRMILIQSVSLSQFDDNPLLIFFLSLKQLRDFVGKECTGLDQLVHLVTLHPDSERERIDVVDNDMLIFSLASKMTRQNGSTIRNALIRAEHIVDWSVLEVLRQQPANFWDACAATHEKNTVNLFDLHTSVFESVFN